MRICKHCNKGELIQRSGGYSVCNRCSHGTPDGNPIPTDIKQVEEKGSGSSIDGNRLIAIFMNNELSALPSNTGVGIKRGYPKQYENWYNIQKDSDLKYQTSWDWLMPVVEKIESISFLDITGFSVRIINHFVCIYMHEKNIQDGILFQSEFRKKYDSKLSAVYEAVLYFINWYNDLTPPLT